MSRRVLSGVVVALLLLTTASGQQPTRQPISQPPTPTFTVKVEYVEVDVRVTDSTGNLVRDLTKDDFQNMRVFATPFRAASNASVLVGIELVGRDLPARDQRDCRDLVRGD